MIASVLVMRAPNACRTRSKRKMDNPVVLPVSQSAISHGVKLPNLSSAKSSKGPSESLAPLDRPLHAYRHKVSVEDGVLLGSHCPFHILFLIKSRNGGHNRWNSTLLKAIYCQRDLATKLDSVLRKRGLILLGNSPL